MVMSFVFWLWKKGGALINITFRIEAMNFFSPLSWTSLTAYADSAVIVRVY